MTDKWNMLLHYEKVACVAHSNQQDVNLQRNSVNDSLSASELKVILSMSLG